MKENLKFRLDLLESQLANLNEQESRSKLRLTQYVLAKAPVRDDAESIEAEVAKIKSTLAERNIHHAVVKLQRNLKTVKQTEVLKLKKRAKGASNNTLLAQEEESTKSMDVHEWAKDIVYRTVSKNYEGLVDFEKKAMEKAHNNVYGRVCKVKTVKKITDDLLQALSQWYTPTKPLPASLGNQKDTQVSAKRDLGTSSLDSRSDPRVTSTRTEQDFDDSNQKITKLDETAEVITEIPGDASESDHDSDGGFFEQDIGDSDSDSDSDHEDNNGLPTLQQGYVSGSESEAEGNKVVPERKNRRGQRARRKIWEQKYGTRAKHMIKEQEEAARRQREKEMRSARKQQKIDERKAKTQAAMDPKTLHPSWQAKKRAAETQQQAKFEGKKIKFD